MSNYNVNVCGKTYELKFTTRSICALEKILGYSVLSPNFLGDKTIDRTVKMLWAALLHSDKELTIDNVFDLFDSSGAELLKVAAIVNDAFVYFWGVSSDSTNSEEEAAAGEKKTETQ